MAKVKEETEIELGSQVKDTISGFKGFAISRHVFLNGCVRYTLQPKADKEGKLPEEKWFDSQDLEIVAPPKNKSSVVKKKTKSIGGPQSSTPNLPSN